MNASYPSIRSPFFPLFLISLSSSFLRLVLNIRARLLARNLSSPGGWLYIYRTRLWMASSGCSNTAGGFPWSLRRRFMEELRPWVPHIYTHGAPRALGRILYPRRGAGAAINPASINPEFFYDTEPNLARYTTNSLKNH